MHDDDALTDHFWWRPGWRPGRPYLTWHVLPDDAVARQVAPLQEALRPVAHLATVRPERLHVTGPGLGFADELGADVTPAVLEAAAARLSGLETVRAAVGPPVVGSTAVLLPVEPADLTHVRRALRDAARDAGVQPPGTDDEPYRPHLTLAYATGPASRRAIIASLDQVDPAPRPHLHVTAVSLLALVMDPPGYDWTVRGEVRLGVGQGTPS